MTARETSFIQGIHRRLKKIAPAVRCVKFALRFVNGWPDTGYFAPGGNLIWVEYKIHPNAPTAQQKKMIDELRTLGQIVSVITKHDDFAIIDDGNTLTRMSIATIPEWILLKLNHHPTTTTCT